MSQTKVIKDLQSSAVNSVSVARGDMKLLSEATNASYRTVALVVNEGKYTTFRHQQILATAKYLETRRADLERELAKDVMAYAKKALDSNRAETVVAQAKTDAL